MHITVHSFRMFTLINIFCVITRIIIFISLIGKGRAADSHSTEGKCFPNM